MLFWHIVALFGLIGFILAVLGGMIIMVGISLNIRSDSCIRNSNIMQQFLYSNCHFPCDSFWGDQEEEGKHLSRGSFEALGRPLKGLTWDFW